MQDEMPLFSKTESIRAREQAIDEVEENAEMRWLTEATTALLRVAQTRGTFTSDDVFMAMPEDVRYVREPRAMGAIMRSGVRGGLIEPTGEFRETDHVASHRRPKRVWRMRR